MLLRAGRTFNGNAGPGEDALLVEHAIVRQIELEDPARHTAGLRATATERCPSGLRSTLGKRVWG